MKLTKSCFCFWGKGCLNKNQLFSFILLFMGCTVFAQEQIKGKVVDNNYMPLVGVSVQEKSTSNGVVTDFDGNFDITTTTPNATLIFSYMGFLTQELQLDDTKEHSIVLEENLEALQEVVLIGYGSQTREEVTSAVATVKAEEFTQGAIRDASELIKGKVAGLTISNGSGDPGAGPNISLRGISSLQGGTAPLVLINGVPGSYNSVSPQEIESIDVLKDASAAAIYGTRGANGVILITTKTADRDIKTSIDYQTYTGFSSFGKKADFLNAEEYRNLIAQGESLPYASEDNGYSTNWLDEISRTGFTQSHNLSMKGGSSKSNYVANVNYIDQEGPFIGSFNEEFRVSLDLNHYMFNDKLKLNLNVINGIQNQGSLGDGASFNPTIYRQALIRNPMDSVRDEDGSWTENTNRFQYSNPLAMIEETDGSIQNDWTRITGNTTLTILPGLDAKLMVATARNSNYRGYAESKNHISNVRDGRNGFASRGSDKSKTDYLEFTTTYDKKFGEHKISALAGYSYQYNVNEGYWANNFDFPTDAYSYNNLGSGNALRDGRAGMGSYKNDNTLIGFFGRASYGYNNKYHLLASVRREGSSKFGENNKWGTFPAISAGWTISNEAFLENSNVISSLKLRAGYGETGIIPGASYLSQTLYSYQGYFYNNGEWVQGLVPASNPNPDLKWEKTGEYNVGLDFGFFNSRISGSVDFYSKTTKDMLWNYGVPTPPYLYPSITANVGEMENKGFEILLDVVPVRSDNFQWNSTFTFSHNKNELTSLSNDLYEIEGDFVNTGGVGDPISMSTHRLEVGQPIGQIWGLKSVDITDDGMWIIETAEGERKTLNPDLYNDQNRQYLGNGIPNYYAGWTNNFSFKNFNLSVVLTGAFDFQIINQQRMFYENPTINYNMLTSAFDEVYGKARLAYPQTFVSHYVEDGDYVKVDNITLSYNLNVENISFLNTFQVYASGSNLGAITSYKGLDPEIINNDPLAPGNDSRDKYPSTRIFAIGCNLTF